LTVNNFRFQRKNKEGRTITQDAVDAGSARDKSRLDCPGGDSYCAVQTNLRDQFYDSDGEVDAFGLVVLQNGVGRRLTVPLRGAFKQHREVQDVAAVVPVGISFLVEDGLDKGLLQEDGDSLKDIWNDQESHVQGLIVVALILLLLLCCCCCAGCILWKRCCADVPGVWRTREVEVEDVYYEEPHSKYTNEEFSETHSIDEFDVDEESTQGGPSDEHQSMDHSVSNDASTIATDYDAIENGNPEDFMPTVEPTRKSKPARPSKKLLAITQNGEPVVKESPSLLAITQGGESMERHRESSVNDAATIASDYDVTQERELSSVVSSQRSLNSKSSSRKNSRRKLTTKAKSTGIRKSKRGSTNEDGSVITDFSETSGTTPRGSKRGTRRVTMA